MTTLASTAMERNKATVRHILEQLSGGDVDSFIAALAPGYVRHCQAMPPGFEEIHGPEGMRAFLAGNTVSFPDYREDVEMLVAEGDLVAWRSVGSATHLGPIGPFPATGRRTSFVIIGMHRFDAEGKIAETWTSWDNMAILRQLGLLPAPDRLGS
jgi:predicted ester cyclase